jgi:hypothetical protein
MKTTSDEIDSDFVTLPSTDVLAGVTGGNQHQPPGPHGDHSFGPNRREGGGWGRGGGRGGGPGPRYWPAPRWWPGSSWWGPGSWWRFWR